MKVTDEMVERAKYAYQHAQDWPHKHDDPMREALEAAVRHYTLIPNNLREGNPVRTVDE